MRALVIALQEVRIYLKDKGDLAFSLLLPIAIFALMYGAFGGSSLFHGTAYVVNQDGGGVYANLLLQRLDELENLDVTLLSAAEAESKLEKSDLLLVLYIPEGFSDKLSRGWPAQLTFRQRGNGGQEGQIVASLIRGAAQEINQEIQTKKQVRNAVGGSQEHIDVTVQKFLDGERAQPFVTVDEVTVGSSPDPVNQFLPGIVTMFVLFSITLTARTLVEERKKGTLERLLTTRLSTGQLFIGKFLAGAARGFTQTIILLVLAYIVFRLFTPFSFIEVLVIAVLFAGAGSAIGLLIGAVVRTEDQASWLAVFVTMAMTMLGGTFFEITEGSGLYALSRLSVNTYANEAFKTIITRGGSLANVESELIVMAGVTIVGLVLGRVLFKFVPGGR
ncbi:MAG: ABC transporter permease [Chloroflexota bacterium]